MPNIYARTTKVSNVCGRSDYISNPARQEEIVLHQENMQHSWQEHSAFEKLNQKSNEPNNEAREIVIALPNELANDQEELEQVMNDLALDLLGSNRDYEWAVHWNKGHTNLHAHLLFSERENLQGLEPKLYKKDIWRDKDTNQLAKANSENAFLYAKKGEIQKDKEGNIKYATDPFTVKDKKFKAKSFNQERDKIIQATFKRNGYKLDIYQSEQVAQKKFYKGSSENYLYYARQFNIDARKHNELQKKVKQAEELIPKLEKWGEKMMADREHLEPLERANGLKRVFTTGERKKATESLKKSQNELEKISEETQKIIQNPNILFFKEQMSALDDYIRRAKERIKALYNRLMANNSHPKAISFAREQEKIKIMNEREMGIRERAKEAREIQKNKAPNKNKKIDRGIDR